MLNVGQLNDGYQVLRPALNLGATDIPVGWVVRHDLEALDRLSVKVMCTSCVSNFAGVVRRKLIADANGNEPSSSGIVSEGHVPVRFKNHASAVPGSHARPVAGQSYMTYSALPTGIRLLTDQTDGTSVTEISAAAPIVKISAGALQGRYIWHTAAAEDPAGILSGQATSSSAVTTVVSFLAQPDVARCLTVLPTGTTGDCPTGDVDIIGTDIFGEVITEALTFTADDSTEQITLQAFKTITSIEFPIQDGANATYSVGWNDSLGLTERNSALIARKAFLAVTVEGTLPTLTANAADYTKNLVDSNTVLDGTEWTLILE